MQTRSRFGLNSFTLQRLGWLLLVAGLIIAGTGLRLISGWVVGLRSLFSNDVTQTAGPIYTLEVALGSLLWLTPFMLVAASLFFFTAYQLNQTEVKLTQVASPESGEKNNGKVKIAIVISLILAIALIHLWPLLQSGWETIAADYDEGVHLLAARQFVLGYATHRDYFFTQPPMSLYGLLPAAAFGDGGATTVWLGRFTSVVWSVGASGLVFLCGRKLFSWSGGIVALITFGLDGWGVFIGHEALLEFQLNFFCLLALWAFLNYESHPQNNWWLILCGVAGAAAFLTKLNGILILVGIIGYLLVAKHWRDSLKLLGAFVAATIGLALPVFWNSPTEFIKQIFIFQLVRGADGITRTTRFEVFSISPEASFTLIIAWLGAVGLGLRAARGKKLPGALAVVALWLGLSLIFYTFSRAFYLHYYISLLPALALIAGGFPSLLELISELKPRLVRRLVNVGLVVGLTVGLLAMLNSYSNLGYSPEPQVVGNLIQAQTPAGATVLTFWGLDTFFGGRALPATADGKVLIDHYGAFYYNVYGLNQKNLGEAIGLVFSGYNPGKADPQRILDNAASQELLDELNKRADFTIVSYFGKDYVNLATKALWLQRSKVLVETPDIWFYANNLPHF